MSKKPQAGFSLVEVLISALVVSFGLLSLASLQITSVKGANNAHSQNIASQLTMELSERMRANPQGVSDGFYGGTVACNNRVKRCDGTAVCNARETAAHDLQEIMCGTASSHVGQGGARNLLPQGKLRVTCDGGCDQPNVAHNITFSWSKQVFDKAQVDEPAMTMLTTAVIP